MTISNINLAMSASSYGAYNQKLTSTTKAELEKLGIPFNRDITEQEGKSLLARYKTQHAHNENSSGSNFNHNQKSNKSDLFERAKLLAQKLNIQVEENMPLKTLLTRIEEVLQGKIQSNQNNTNMLNQLKSYSEELASIQAQSMGSTFGAANKALEMSLEMLSLYNKNLLNN